MGILKGLLVVLGSYAVIALAKIYPVFLLPPQSVGSFSGLLGMPSIGSYILLIPFTLISGVILWLGRAFLANQLAYRIFKAKAGFREELGDFGLVHFPLIFVGLSSMIIFVFGLSNIGIFASLFLCMFFFLLMYTYFVNVVMSHHKLNWKKALFVIALMEVIIAVVMFFAGLIALHPLMQNSLMSMTTI